MYSLAFLPGINPGEAFVILSLALLFFGAKKLPEFARGLGTAVREFSKAKDEIQNELTRPPSTPTPQVEAAPHLQPHTKSTNQPEATVHSESSDHV